MHLAVAVAVAVAVLAPLASAQCLGCPTISDPAAVGPTGGTTYTTPTRGRLCECIWQFQYSEGPSQGRLSLSADLSPGDTLTVYDGVAEPPSDEDPVDDTYSYPYYYGYYGYYGYYYGDTSFGDLVVRFEDDPLGTSIYANNGLFVVVLATTASSSFSTLTAEYTAINAAPVITPAEVPRNEYLDMVVVFGEGSPVPFSLVDHDNFDRGMAIDIELEDLGVATTTVALQVPSPDLTPDVANVTFLANDPYRVAFSGPASSAIAVLDAIRIVGTDLYLGPVGYETMYFTVTDLGNSGEGSAEVSSYTEFLSTRCVGVVDVYPGRNESVTSGSGFSLPNSHFCGFRVNQVRRIEFTNMFLEIADDPAQPCYDYIRVYDGADAETGVLISTDLIFTGEICAFFSSLLPVYESASGTLYIELFTDDGFQSGGFDADMVPTEGIFAVQFLDDVGELFASPGIDLPIPSLSVFDVPCNNISVLTESEGSVRVRFADSFQDILDPLAQARGQVKATLYDPVRSPMLRMSRLLRQLVYLADDSIAGSSDVITVSASCDGVPAQSLNFTVSIIAVGINVPPTQFTNAFSILPLAVVVSAPAQTVVTLSMSTSRDTAFLTVDRRAAVGVDVGYANALTFSGLVDDVNAAIAHLAYRSDADGSDTITFQVTSDEGTQIATTDVVIDAQCKGERNIYGIAAAITDRTGPPSDPSDDSQCIWNVYGPNILEIVRYDVVLPGFLQIGSSVDTADLYDSVSLAYYYYNPQPSDEPIVAPDDTFWLNFGSFGVGDTGFIAVFSRADGDNAAPIVVTASDVERVKRDSVLTFDGVYIRDFDATADTVVSIAVSGGVLTAGDTSQVTVLSQTTVSIEVSGEFEGIDAFITTTSLLVSSSIGAIQVSINATDQEGAVGVATMAVDILPCSGTVDLNLDDLEDAFVVFADGSGSQEYATDLDCAWRLRGASAPAVLDFDYLDLESDDGGACTDQLAIYDGATAGGRPLGTFCTQGTLNRGSLVSFSGSFFVQLLTSPTVNAEGFQATYRGLDSGAWSGIGAPPANADPERTGASVAVVGVLDDQSPAVVTVAGDNGLGPVYSPLLFTVDTLWQVLTDVSVSDSPDRRSNAACTGTGDGSLFLFGGVSLLGAPLGDAWLATVDVAAATIAWESVAPTTPVVGARAAYLAAADAVYVFGGETASGAASDALEVFSVASNAWSEPLRTAPWPPARSLHTVAIDQGALRLFVYGGIGADGAALSDLWMYNVGPGTWTSAGSAAVARQQDAGLWPTLAGSLLGSGMLGPEFAITGPGGVWAYNATAGTWIELGQDAPPDASDLSAAVAGQYGGRDALFAYTGGVMAVSTLGIQGFSAGPSLSPKAGGTAVTLVGERFSYCPDFRCEFAGASTSTTSQGLVESSRRAVCTTPADPDTTDADHTVAVGFVCGAGIAQQRFAAGSSTIIYFSGPEIAGISPGEVAPGGSVTIALAGVSDAVLDLVTAPLCSFDNEIVSGTLGDDGAITCTAPDTLAPGSDLAVRVGLDGQQITSDEVPLAIAQAISPASSSNDSTVLIVIIVAAVVAVIALVGGRILYQRQELMRVASAKAPWQIPFSMLTLDTELASGSYGTVFRGTFRGSEVAVKVIKEQETVTVSMIEAFRAESELMAELRHPNVVLFMGACTIPPNIAIVLEFMPLGSLYNLLHDETVDYGWEEARRIAFDVVKGMNYLHSASPPIIHRDLKSLNVLVDNNWTMKVSDFGLTQTQEAHRKNNKKAKAFETAEAAQDPEAIGTVYWAAPEILDGKEASLASDIYSFAITLWEICSRENPYDGEPLPVVVSMVMESAENDDNMLYRPHLNEGIPEDLASIITECWQNNPKARPSFQTLHSRLADSGRGMTGTSGSHGPGGSSNMYRHSTADVEGFRGEMAVVFVSVPNATELWEAEPEGMRDGIRLLQAILHDKLSSTGGVFASQEREMTMLVFESVSNAVAYATMVQDALPRVEWPAKLGSHEAAARIEAGGTVVQNGLRVAVGIHFGEPESQLDQRSRRFHYTGPVVNQAAKMASQALGGQTMLSAAALEDWGKTDAVVVERIDVVQEPAENGCVVMYPTRLHARHQYLKDQVRASTAMSMTSDPTSALVGHPRWVIPFKNLSLEAQIGAGSFGTVHRAKWNGATVAVKTLFRRNLKMSQQMDLQAEVGVASMLRHPNVCQFLGVCIEEDRLCLVTEYADRGSLYDAYIVARIPHLSAHKIAQIAKDTAVGMAYLHGLSPPILHRDLKPRNILVTKDWSVKITDFGLSRVKSENQTMTKAGTSGYMAPEVLRGQRYGEAADVFSMGIVMWEILTKSIAFSDLERKHNQNAVAMIGLAVVDGQRPIVPNTDDARGRLSKYVELMVQSWSQDPATRPTFSSLSGQLATLTDALRLAEGGDMANGPKPLRKL